MQEVSRSYHQSFRSEIVLNSGIGLDYISSFPSHIQVENSSIREMQLSWDNFEHVRTILECAAKLSCVDGQLERDLVVIGFSIQYLGIVLDRGVAKDEYLSFSAQ